MAKTMDHPLRHLSSALRTRLPTWLGGQGGLTTTAQEAVWPLAEALQCKRELGASFVADPLAAGDARFVARASELETLATVIESWQNGCPVMAAVTGPRGCGITSLLNQLPALLSPNTACRSEQLAERLRSESDVLALIARLFDLQAAPDSRTTLIDQLNAAAPRVLILDDAHFLAFRVMGARGAARSLGAIMVATQQRHLWVIGCRRQAWRRLMYMHQVHRFFTHVLELEYFSAEQLNDVIVARHGETTEETSSRDLQRLQQLSGGKPDLAFLYLQCGIPTETGTYRPLDVSVLKQLEMDDLFTLAELAVHGSLQLEEHCQIFRTAAENSQMQLNQLCNWGLVERLDPNGGSSTARFRITPILSALVSEHLYKSNYLY
jgi:hypothetical protein